MDDPYLLAVKDVSLSRALISYMSKGLGFSTWSRRTYALGKFIRFLHTSFPKARGNLSI